MREKPPIDFEGRVVEQPGSAGELLDLATKVTPVKLTFPTVDAWLERRSQTIGGSEAAAVLGVHQFLSPYTLYMLKSGLIDAKDLSDVDEVQYGKLIEPVAAELYIKKTGRALIDHGVHSFIHPGLPCSVSIDRETWANDKPGSGMLEIKSTEKYSFKELQEEIPLDWQIQVQHGLGVMGWEWASLAILIHRKLYWLDIDRNDEFIALLFQKEREFWQRIKELRPPEPDASESTSDTIKRRYPYDIGAVRELPPEAVEWHYKIESAKAVIKHQQLVLAENENKLKEAIGAASYGQFGDIRYSWKLQHRSGYTVKPTEFRVLREVKGGR